mmetsp:Transcript_25957/g.36786  ORF Transcript_25957/g.36786 Transcript_25957/m.36786 type:complete len:114 (+) Transcript_25957:2607-2948(+)
MGAAKEPVNGDIPLSLGKRSAATEGSGTVSAGPVAETASSKAAASLVFAGAVAEMVSSKAASLVLAGPVAETGVGHEKVVVAGLTTGCADRTLTDSAELKCSGRNWWSCWIGR